MRTVNYLMCVVLCLTLGLSCDDEPSPTGSTAGEVTAGEVTAGEVTAGEVTAGEVTAGEVTAGEVIAGEVTAGEVNSISLTVDIQNPMSGALVTDAQSVGFTAIVNIEPVDIAPYISWTLLSDQNRQIPVLYDPSQGLIQASLTELENRNQTLTLTARIAPDYEQSFQVSLVRDCQLSIDFDTNLDENLWRVLGSAVQDSRGWLEMTNFQINRKGALFLVGAPFNPGDLDVSFKIASGACDEIGSCAGQEISDGYAMSIWNITTNDIDNLWSIVGGNGAGISLSRLPEAGLTERPEGFTIEFDTYPNYCPNNGFYDPVQAPHVEIYFDGKYHMADDNISREESCMLTNPGEAYPGYWSETPALRDNQWHDVRVLIQGNHIQVWLDETSVIDTMVPNFEFKGGVLAFSGGSGAVPAYQRFDDLIINSECTP